MVIITINYIWNAIIFIFYGSITIIDLLRDSRTLIRALNELTEEAKRNKKPRANEDDGTCDRCNKHFHKLSHHIAHCKAK